MQLLIFTGAPGSARAAAASAAALAAGGARVLLAAVGPGRGVPLAPEPAPAPVALGPSLDVWSLDAPGDLRALWEELRGRVSLPGPAIGGDELPIIPGSDLFLAVAGLRRHRAAYDIACVDVGPPEALLRALSVPDAFRWGLRLLLGLDRGPGRSPASQARALLPAALIPPDWTGPVQDARVALERLRDELVAAARVRLLVAPEPAGLAEAAVTVAALQLFGLPVEGLIAGPLLPEGAARLALEELAAEQEAALAEAAWRFPGLPIWALEAAAAPADLEALRALGARIYGPGGPAAADLSPPLRLSGPPAPEVAIDLPGLRREDLALTINGDELIVRVGPYRRHLLLPEGLRGGAAIRAARQGDTLFVRLRS